jgi:1-deoxy-D-xylulose-5-phosphate synthase
MNEHALRSAMYWAKDYTKGPVVIRYPRGRGSERHSMRPVQPLQFAKSIVRHAGNKIAVLSVGSVGVEVERAIAQNNLQETVTHIDAMWLKPLDLAAIGNVFSAFDKVITVEEACLAGGYGQQIKALAFNSQFKGSITCLGLPDEFVEHGQIDELRAKYGLDANSIANLIQRLL